MPHWLVKSEPSTWSWDDQVKAGAKGTAWEGVRNHLAKKHLMAMKKGELAFYYHSGETKEIVGIVEIISEYEPDPSDRTGKFGLVYIKAREPLPSPVTLEQCKKDKKLSKMVLLNNSRLSVQPVTSEEWSIIRQMGGSK